jgi:hypothetical protein
MTLRVYTDVTGMKPRTRMGGLLSEGDWAPMDSGEAPAPKTRRDGIGQIPPSIQIDPLNDEFSHPFGDSFAACFPDSP